MTTGRGGETGRLVVTETADAATASDRDSTFVVDEALRQTPQAEYDEVYRVISNADVDLGLEPPVYQIAWKHVLNYRRGRLHELTLLYNRLEERVRTENPVALVCEDGTDRAYRAVVEDVAAEYDIPVEAGLRPAYLTNVKRFLVSTVLALPFLLDQVLGLLLKHVAAKSQEGSVLYVPALGRLDSMTPVMEQSPFEYGVLVTSMASSWLWTVRDDELDAFDPAPVSQFTDLRTIARQVASHVAVGRKALLGDDLRDQLDDVLSTELDVSLDRGLTYALQQGFRTRMFTSIFCYHLLGTAIEETGCEKIVIGGLSPAGKAVIARGIDEDVDVYHVPHGIGAAGNCPNPPPALTQFVSGDLEKRFYAESPQVGEPWDCIATGRPYLTELSDEYRGRRSEPDTDDTLDVVLATQPIAPRRDFVREAITALDAGPHDATVTIKIHPSEDPETYASFTRGRDDVTVAESDLHDHLHAADLTMTVNSNVGVESVVVGTPCVCVNWWDPIIPVPMYARFDSFPVLDGPGALREFVASLDDETLTRVRDDEVTFVEDSYVLDGDAERAVVDALRT